MLGRVEFSDGSLSEETKGLLAGDSEDEMSMEPTTTTKGNNPACCSSNSCCLFCTAVRNCSSFYRPKTNIN